MTDNFSAMISHKQASETNDPGDQTKTIHFPITQFVPDVPMEETGTIKAFIELLSHEQKELVKTSETHDMEEFYELQNSSISLAPTKTDKPASIRSEHHETR